MRDAIVNPDADDSTGQRGRWLWASAGLVALGLAALPLDHAVSGWARGLPISNDPAREMRALGQFGQLTSVVITGVLIALLDTKRWRRLFDWALAGGLVWMVVMTLKMLAGRVRPRVEVEPGRFLGPVGRIDLGDGAVHAWDLGMARSADLWSMPSNHAAFAVVLSVFLAALYPKLRWFGIVMVAIVAFARVQGGAHFPSDVLIGTGVGLAIATPTIRGYWGVRLLDAAWRRLIDRSAGPAYPAVRAACEEPDAGPQGSPDPAPGA